MFPAPAGMNRGVIMGGMKENHAVAADKLMSGVTESGSVQLIGEIVLSWPNRAMSPNSRTHWAVKARAVKAARTDGYMAARAAGYNSETFSGYDGKLHLFIDFYCPTRRYIDADNALSMCKAANDGVADCLGVNDRRFVYHPFVRDEVYRGGRVVIKIVT